MRGAALVLFASGCIISAPEGATQSWPPSLGVTVQAVTSGDLDGNGSTDIVVYASGRESQAGMYLLTGGKDLGGGSSKPVRSFSTFVPAPLQPTTAALQLAGPAPEIYVATAQDLGDEPGDKVAIRQYSNIFDQKAEVTTTVPTGNAVLWLHPMMFPGDMQHIAVSNGAKIDHVVPLMADVKPVPGPAGPTWDLAQLATSYSSGSEQVAVVATPTQIQRATIPTTAGAMFAWTVVREGAAWLGQVSVDLDGDGREEIVGLDLMGKQLCVVDPGAATVPVTPVCLAIPMLTPASEVTLHVGTNITMNAGPDILIVQATGSETQFSLVEDYTYTQGTLISTMIHPVGVGGPAHGRTVIANSGPGTPSSVLVFGTDGAVGCVMGPC